MNRSHYVSHALHRACRRASPLIVSTLLCVAAMVGCDDSVEYNIAETSSAVASGQSAFTGTAMVLSAMPDGDSKTPTEIKEAGEASGSAVVAGRIDAGDLDPFLPGKLSFMISQLPDADHATDDPDHADNCPFCKRKLENAPKAIVEFRDSNGQVLDGNARSELGVEQGDVVYVTGAAEFNAAVNTVMIDASGVFRATSP